MSDRAAIDPNHHKGLVVIDSVTGGSFGLEGNPDSGGLFVELVGNTSDPTSGYGVSDVDEAADPKYYGFLNNTGAWYILRNTGETAYRYVRGTSGYTTAWTNRASQSYDYFDAVF